MKLTEEQIIDIYKNIDYTREWFKNHKYRYKLGQGFNPMLGEYFLLDLYYDENKHDTEVWLVRGTKPKYDKRRKQKLPFEPIAFIINNRQFGTINGYFQIMQDEV